jgi:CYTH domain-containing protein
VFDEAWPYTHERLNKRRFKLIYSTLLWDIDFYRWSRPYFALAEVEMPPGTKEYDMLPLIQPYIHFVVPGADRRFDARHLADETHVEAVALGFGLLKSQPP